MKRRDLRSELAFLLSVEEDSADQAFQTTRLNKAVQYAYEHEVRQAKLEGQSRWFKANANLSWPASQVTFVLPQVISKAGIIQIWDITHSDPGIQLSVRDGPYQSEIHWLNHSTLQWGDVGPSEAKTLRVDYMAVAEWLAGDDDEPLLVPPEYHWLLVWSAACFLRTVGDESAPQQWERTLAEFRIDYWKYLSRGRPYSDVPAMTYSGGAGSQLADPTVEAGPGGGLSV